MLQPLSRLGKRKYCQIHQQEMGIVGRRLTDAKLEKPNAEFTIWDHERYGWFSTCSFYFSPRTDESPGTSMVLMRSKDTGS